jgi:uncharacterized protein HemX
MNQFTPSHATTHQATPSQAHARAKGANTNGRGWLLACVAGLLALNLVATVAVGPDGLVSRATAQQGGTEEPSGFVAAAEQRKMMLNELKQLGARMERIEAQLKAGINVKVTEMPSTGSGEDRGGGRR